MSPLSCLASRGDPMKSTWFHHTDCSTEQADELVKRYKARGVRVERSLNPDYVTGLSVHSFQHQTRQRARIAAGETGCGVNVKTYQITLPAAEQ